MKVKDFFRQSVLMLLVASGIVSCTETVDNVPQDSDSKEVIVPLSFSGEVLDMGTTPLSRAAGNDLLYIQVRRLMEDGYAQPYAHGLFDNSDNLTIALKEEESYIFSATIVKDGKNRIYNYDNHYSIPFDADLTNKFVIDGNFDTWIIMRGSADLVDMGYFEKPDIDRYFGVSELYTVNPKDIQPVNINLLRTVFGVKVVTEGFTSGDLLIEVSGAPQMIISAPQTEITKIFSLSDLNEANNQDMNYVTGEMTNNYTEYAMVRILRISNGETIPVDEKEILFTRNMLTTLKVRIESNMYENGVSITTETSEMLPDDQGEIEFVGGGDF